MIVVDLLCASTHRFEGWFPSAEALEAQLAQGTVRCPLCGSAEVRRLPSAPYVHTGERGADTPEPSPPAPAPATVAPDPQRLAQLWQTLRALGRQAEDVGVRFPEEARRIHRGEADARPIRGQSSTEEFLSLLEEGIEVLPLPPLDEEMH